MAYPLLQPWFNPLTTVGHLLVIIFRLCIRSSVPFMLGTSTGSLSHLLGVEDFDHTHSLLSFQFMLLVQASPSLFFVF